MNSMLNYDLPVITDNRDLRKEITAVDKHFEEIKKEASKFPKVNGVIVDSGLVVDVKFCPVCGSSIFEQLFLKWGFLYVKCQSCEHVFVRNRIKDSSLLKLYSESNIDKLDREAQKSSKSQDYWCKVYSKYLNFLAGCEIKNRNLLDVGCGAGEFLRFCKENSAYCLHAIDFADDTYTDLVNLIGKENYYFKQKIEDADFKNAKFGIISFWGVLEHLSHPKEAMHKCHDILDADGRMLVLIPNLFSRAFRILGVNVPTLNSYEHVQFFTPKSFSHLCKYTGFEIVKSFQELPVIDLMYEYIDYDYSLVESILKNNESYYLVYVIRKK